MFNTNEDNEHRYDDIIKLPHHVSKTRQPMSRLGRAAQFSPFAALSGYDSAIGETARLTDEKAELAEDAKQIIDSRLQYLQCRIGEKPAVTITYFKPDERKSGGTYSAISGALKKIDAYERTVILTNGVIIPIDDICSIESALLGEELY